MRNIKIKLNGVIPEGHIAVFTANIGEYYYIGHTTSFEWLIKEIKSKWAKYVAGAGVDTDNLFLPILKAAANQETAIIILKVEFTHESGYQVLKYELEKMETEFGTKFCLNRINIPYIPKTIHAKRGSNWLTQNQYLNFMKLLRKYDF